MISLFQIADFLKFEIEKCIFFLLFLNFLQTGPEIFISINSMYQIKVICRVLFKYILLVKVCWSIFFEPSYTEIVSKINNLKCSWKLAFDVIVLRLQFHLFTRLHQKQRWYFSRVCLYVYIFLYSLLQPKLLDGF